MFSIKHIFVFRANIFVNNKPFQLCQDFSTPPSLRIHNLYSLLVELESDETLKWSILLMQTKNNNQMVYRTYENRSNIVFFFFLVDRCSPFKSVFRSLFK